MTREEAIRILDPETTAEALAEIEYYAGLRGKEAAIKAVDDACILAVAAIREQEQRRWIPVTDRLPEPWKEVIVFSNCNFFETAVYFGIPAEWRVTWNHDFLKHGSITHWMPLPEPPKEDS